MPSQKVRKTSDVTLPKHGSVVGVRKGAPVKNVSVGIYIARMQPFVS